MSAVVPPRQAPSVSTLKMVVTELKMCIRDRLSAVVHRLAQRRQHVFRDESQHQQEGDELEDEGEARQQEEDVYKRQR